MERADRSMAAAERAGLWGGGRSLRHERAESEAGRGGAPAMARGVVGRGEFACPEIIGAVVKWTEAFPAPLIL